MADYGSQDVKCPFYKKDNKTKIICEGVINDTCTQPFKSTKKKEIYKNNYCCTFHYKECPYFKLLDRKYD